MLWSTYSCNPAMEIAVLKENRGICDDFTSDMIATAEFYPILADDLSTA